MLNRVILMGRLVSDPELKTTASGISVTSFRIAVDRNYVKQGEERKADFIDIVCWRQQAEFVCRYFGKGAMIAVDGQLQSRTYQAKDGTNRYVTEVVAENVSFTGERRDNSRATETSPTAHNPTAASSPMVLHRSKAISSSLHSLRSRPTRAAATLTSRKCRLTTICRFDF